MKQDHNPASEAVADSKFICTDCRWPINKCTCHDPIVKRKPPSMRVLKIDACPFCKNQDCEVAESQVPNINGGKKQAVFCHECFCEGPTADTQQDAIDLWNRRPAAPVGSGQQDAEPLLGMLRQIIAAVRGDSSYPVDADFLRTIIEKQVALCRRHGNVGEDTERLDWLEANAPDVSNSHATACIVVGLNQTVRAAIDQARQQGGGK